MTLGRPMMTHQHDLPLPSSLYEEDFVNYDSRSRREKISFLTFYVETIKLYQILGRVVADIYKPWSAYSMQDASGQPSRKHQNESQTIMSLAEDLCNYEDDISLPLHWDRGQQFRDELPDVPRAIIQRQVNILCAR